MSSKRQKLSSVSSLPSSSSNGPTNDSNAQTENPHQRVFGLTAPLLLPNMLGPQRKRTTLFEWKGDFKTVELSESKFSTTNTNSEINSGVFNLSFMPTPTTTTSNSPTPLFIATAHGDGKARIWEYSQCTKNTQTCTLDRLIETDNKPEVKLQVDTTANIQSQQPTGVSIPEARHICTLDACSASAEALRVSWGSGVTSTKSGRGNRCLSTLAVATANGLVKVWDIDISPQQGNGEMSKAIHRATLEVVPGEQVYSCELYSAQNNRPNASQTTHGSENRAGCDRLLAAASDFILGFDLTRADTAIKRDEGVSSCIWKWKCAPRQGVGAGLIHAGANRNPNRTCDVFHVAFDRNINQDSNIFAAACGDGTVRLFDVRAREMECGIAGCHDRFASCCDWSKHSAHAIASTSGGGGVAIWDTRKISSGSLPQSVSSVQLAHTGRAFGCVFLNGAGGATGHEVRQRKQNRLLTWGSDGKCVLWGWKDTDRKDKEEGYCKNETDTLNLIHSWSLPGCFGNIYSCDVTTYNDSLIIGGGGMQTAGGVGAGKFRQRRQQSVSNAWLWKDFKH